ncbi:hypothetical protein BJV78DRAFT_1163097 [Lactifluus subvellereus]|nr:hypothetical protein BJV78DRAFT_1163097 [Lactifluus subvellereus]
MLTSNGSTGLVRLVGKAVHQDAALWCACTAIAVGICGQPRSSPLTTTTPVSFCFATT